MLAFLAPAALRLVAGKALVNAKNDALAAGRWLTTLSAPQLLCLILALLLVADHIALVLAHRHGAKVEAQLAASARDLGTARANNAVLKAAVARQNAAISDLAAKSADQQKAAAKAEERALQRADVATASSRRLAASAAQPRPGGACEPSQALKDAWK